MIIELVYNKNFKKIAQSTCIRTGNIKYCCIQQITITIKQNNFYEELWLSRSADIRCDTVNTHDILTIILQTFKNIGYDFIANL
ncbi:hypothetical protein Avbf_11291 [Armadillidium vulgare]|nr:hypothetical protein Avbf_11291 [Armadillidium vulgare]